ncbi:trimethylamine methyltransferase family protein, partial [Deferrisoma sp.]
QYLTQPKTFKLCRTEFFLPKLANRANYEGWKQAGGLDARQRAAQAVEDRLARYQKPEIDPDVERDLAAYVQTRKRGG